MSLSLRASLTAWFAGLASVVVCGGAIVLYTAVHTSLINGLDSMLQAHAEGVGALCEWENGSVHLEGYYEIADNQPLLGGIHGFEVRLLLAEEIQVHRGLPLPDRLPDHATGARTYGDLRVLATTITFPPREPLGPPRPEPGSPGFSMEIRTAASILPVDGQLRTIRWFALSTAVLSVASAVAFGFFLSKRVTTPLTRLSDAAVRVRDGEDAVLPRSGTGDEIDRLASLFDEAFTAVRGSVEQQKRFVANAAHELRNPVAIIASIAEIGQRRDRSAVEHRALLSEIEQVTRRMASMLESLLTLARLDATGRLTGPPVDLGRIVHGVVAELQTSAAVDLDLSGATVRGDAQLLTMLVRNLLNNAVRHAIARVAVSVRRTGSDAFLVVHDDGSGLPPMERSRVFEQFFRGQDAKGQGVGLGLALVRAIARGHGGDCRIEPSAVGLRVEVRLPFAEVRAAVSDDCGAERTASVTAGSPPRPPGPA